MSLPLLRRELRANYKMILLFLAVITLYSTVIIAMYDPKLGASLDLMAESMPELFAAFGMTNAGATMLDFVANYLYGFILIAIPMLCLVLIAVRLVARYVDQGSMAYLLATPNTRSTIVITQLFFILLCTFFLVGCVQLPADECRAVVSASVPWRFVFLLLVSVLRTEKSLRLCRRLSDRFFADPDAFPGRRSA